ncbi:glycerophosphodiester phosphodiesterase (plasmid) [Deinococcus psychrotolerans]|uniref:Glycerophosphodiester phosphodiesterase n=1 Tax=Deinococcus psychrotolerans TaxID=2489213 RepID=A0A3G8YGX8_9DEIO|nr:glycerophosphodiester phosphodiesterase [Deinococcus psychrotolerans]AZI44579.1 glycerophosphodiester phosphodiesterase [Deinococcus psychrotolerans]
MRFLLAGLLLLSACAARPSAAKPNPYITSPAWILAHQGGEDLWPSNTLLAFDNAAKLGIQMLDTDMHATQDGALVLSHDETVDRLTDGHGKIRELSLAQLKSFDAGYRFTADGGQTYPFRGQGLSIPTLDEALSAHPELPWTIEIKQDTPSIAAPFCAALRQHGVTGKVMVASFSDKAMQDFRAECPEVATSMTESELRPLVLLSKIGLANLAGAPGQAAQVPVRSGGLEVVTPSFVRQMHGRGVAVHVWTINDPAEMRRLLSMGVDGIDTDRPDLLRAVLAETKVP